MTGVASIGDQLGRLRLTGGLTVWALAAATRTAPEWVRFYRLARDVTLELGRRPVRRHSAELAQVAQQLSLRI